MKQQTAVEWLEFMAEEIIRDSGDLGHDFPVLMGYIQQAKQMEKEQIINAHIDGQSLVSCKDEYAEQYYNETYNNGND
jgi:hypothetical protein